MAWELSPSLSSWHRPTTSDCSDTFHVLQILSLPGYQLKGEQFE